jgi:hypothetical protein
MVKNHLLNPNEFWGQYVIPTISRSDAAFNACRTLLGALDAKGLMKWDEAFPDGSFAQAKKGAIRSAKTKRGQGTKWIVMGDGEGVPLKPIVTSSVAPAKNSKRRAWKECRPRSCRT